MLNEKEGIIVVVATKNRVSLLTNALESISIQTKKPLDVFVASDSTYENECVERTLCSKYGFCFLKDKYTHNYAGNLNTAVESIFAKYAFENRYDLDKVSLVLKKYGYDLNVRAEALSYKVFVDISNALS